MPFGITPQMLVNPACGGCVVALLFAGLLYRMLMKRDEMIQNLFTQLKELSEQSIESWEKRFDDLLAEHLRKD